MPQVIRYGGTDYEEKQRSVPKVNARALLAYSKRTTFGGPHMCKVVAAETEHLRRGALAYVQIKPTWVEGEVYEDEIDHLVARLETQNELVERAKEVHETQVFDHMDEQYRRRGRTHTVDRDRTKWSDEDWQIFHEYSGSWQVEFARKALAGRGAKPFAKLEIEGHEWKPGMTLKDLKKNGASNHEEAPAEAPPKKRRGRKKKPIE
jgi:hypothetical protein